MYKLFSILAFLCLSFSAIAQEKITASEKKALDSMREADEYLKMLEEEDKSYLDISLGIGNGSFSTNNPAQNATGVVKQLVVTPSISFHHKSGFSFGITPFITNDSSGKTRLYQTGISPSYNYEDDKVNLSLSYTRYLCDLKKYNNDCLYQNEFFGSIKATKGAIQPGLQLGYANGNYKEVSWNTFTTPTGVTRLIRDSTHNKTSYFSTTVLIGHDFVIENVFDKKDELDISPSIMLNAGSDNLTTTHVNKLYDRLKFLSSRKKTSEANKFQLQSVAFSTDILYGIGKFYVQPSIYVDYYLPETTNKRLSSIFAFAIGVSL